MLKVYKGHRVLSAKTKSLAKKKPVEKISNLTNNRWQETASKHFQAVETTNDYRER